MTNFLAERVLPMVKEAEQRSIAARAQAIEAPRRRENGLLVEERRHMGAFFGQLHRLLSEHHTRPEAICLEMEPHIWERVLTDLTAGQPQDTRKALAGAEVLRICGILAKKQGASTPEKPQSPERQGLAQEAALVAPDWKSFGR